jgi:hypothetical protein
MCTGDCSGDNFVTVDEIVTLANIALGRSTVDRCPPGDAGGDGLVTVDEIVSAVNNALTGCPTAPTPTTPVETPTPDRGPAIDLGSASGAPGSIVTIAVTLSGTQNDVTATSNDIEYDPTKVRIVQNDGDIACEINPAIGRDSSAAKIILVGLLPDTGDVDILRIGLVSFTSIAPIPDGPLYTCELEIDASAASGDVVLLNSPGAANGLGQRVSVAGADGVITVE